VGVESLLHQEAWYPDYLSIPQHTHPQKDVMSQHLENPATVHLANVYVHHQEIKQALDCVVRRKKVA